MSVGFLRSPINLARFEMEVSSDSFFQFMKKADQENSSQGRIVANLREIEVRYASVIRVWWETLDAFGKFKETHKALPEWKGNFGKRKVLEPKPDTLSNFYTEQMNRLNILIHRVAAARNEGRAKLSLDQVHFVRIKMETSSQKFLQFICRVTVNRSKEDIKAKLKEIDLQFVRVIRVWQQALETLANLKKIHKHSPEWKNNGISDLYHADMNRFNSLITQVTCDRNAIYIALEDQLMYV